jgi:hypothetical protein
MQKDPALKRVNLISTHKRLKKIYGTSSSPLIEAPATCSSEIAGCIGPFFNFYEEKAIP